MIPLREHQKYFKGEILSFSLYKSSSSSREKLISRIFNKFSAERNLLNLSVNNIGNIFCIRVLRNIISSGLVREEINNNTEHFFFKPNIATPETWEMAHFLRLHQLLIVVRKPSTSHLLTLVCWSHLHQSKYLLHSWNSFYQAGRVAICPSQIIHLLHLPHVQNSHRSQSTSVLRYQVWWRSTSQTLHSRDRESIRE